MKFLLIFLLVAVCISQIPEWMIVYDTKMRRNLTPNELLHRLSQNQMVFAGEYHDHDYGHKAELILLEEFHKINTSSPFALSLEMFERDAQAFVDLYVNDQLDETNFLKLSRPWPNYQKDYKQLIEYSKKNFKKVIASNVPRRYASFVAQKKENILFNMPSIELSYMAKNIVSPRDRYWELFEQTMRGHVPQDKIWDYYRSQCLKDDTMAMSIDEFMSKGDKPRLITFQGSFHSDEYLGIYYKVKSNVPKLLIKILPQKEMRNLPRYMNVSDLLILAPDNQ